MKKIIALFLLSTLINLTMPSFAKSITVKSSTEIPITINESYSSKNVMEGQRVEATIAEDVIIDDAVIFKAGNEAKLSISESREASFVGVAGEIYIVNGEVADTKGNLHTIEFYKKYIGEEKRYPKVLLGCGLFIILAPLALFGFVKGGQAEINTGDIINANLKDEFVY